MFDRIPHMTKTMATELIRAVNHFHSALDKPIKLEIPGDLHSLSARQKVPKLRLIFPYIPHSKVNPYLARTEHNFIENFASQATHRWRKR